jgi:hypothetical protein
MTQDEKRAAVWSVRGLSTLDQSEADALITAMDAAGIDAEALRVGGTDKHAGTNLSWAEYDHVASVARRARLSVPQVARAGLWSFVAILEKQLTGE